MRKHKPHKGAGPQKHCGRKSYCGLFSAADSTFVSVCALRLQTYLLVNNCVWFRDVFGPFRRGERHIWLNGRLSRNRRTDRSYLREINSTAEIKRLTINRINHRCDCSRLRLAGTNGRTPNHIREIRMCNQTRHIVYQNPTRIYVTHSEMHAGGCCGWKEAVVVEVEARRIGQSICVQHLPGTLGQYIIFW